ETRVSATRFCGNEKRAYPSVQRVDFHHSAAGAVVHAANDRQSRSKAGYSAPFESTVLRQREDLDDSDSDLSADSLRDYGITSRRQSGDDRRFGRITRSESAVLDRGGLIAGDNSAQLRRLPVIVPS